MLLVSLCASLQPPPPELGYTVTVKDLDEEKKAGISKIQKVLETPGKLHSVQSVNPSFTCKDLNTRKNIYRIEKNKPLLSHG